jgi:membrane-associated protease RseP (regulator of RpoE activity)
MQKSLPPNKDALFDIGADGPVTGFVVATFASIVGLMLLIPAAPMEGTTSIQVPIMWTLLARLLASLNLFPVTTPDQILLLHPITFAGWVGLLVTMLNLLPAAMLDGGHVARSLAGEKVRLVLTGLSIAYLVLMGFWPMALFVVFISMYKHPGPLDDVSSLSSRRKALTVLMIVIFILCSFVPEIPAL